MLFFLKTRLSKTAGNALDDLLSTSNLVVGYLVNIYYSTRMCLLLSKEPKRSNAKVSQDYLGDFNIEAGPFGVL